MRQQQRLFSRSRFIAQMIGPQNPNQRTTSVMENPTVSLMAPGYSRCDQSDGEAS